MLISCGCLSGRTWNSSFSYGCLVQGECGIVSLAMDNLVSFKLQVPSALGVPKNNIIRCKFLYLWMSFKENVE